MASYTYENRKGSGKKLKVHFDLPKDEQYPIDHHKKHSSSSISSQSSLDSDDNIEILEESSNVGGGSPAWSFQSGSVMHSPPLQLMSPNPNSGYDPHRIPSSVFASKPTSPMEWSVQSNESLFSLHLGNYSFSRDQFFAFNSKSGELPRTNDFNSASMTLPPVQEVNHNNGKYVVDEKRHSLSSESSRDSIDTLDEATNLPLDKDNTRTSKEKIDLVLKDDGHDKTKTSTNVDTTRLDKTHEDHNKAVAVPSEEPKNYATTVSYRSVESDMSNHSFQFPILTADGVRTSSETIESEKQEKNENKHHHHHHHHQQQQQQQQHQQAIEKPFQPPSPKFEKTPKHCFRGWCCCSCFSCSPCY